MIRINKTASNVHFNETETDRELIFQQLYSIQKTKKPTRQLSAKRSNLKQTEPS